MINDRLTRIAWYMPMLIILYMSALAAWRLSFSPFLEVDEAQFMGAVDFRLVYENSHPPLYNWLLRIVLEMTGWDWAFSSALVRYSLLGAYHLLIWDAARRLSDERTALLATAAAAFMPQIVWMSAHTLAHSTMVMTGVAATIHATTLIAHRPDRGPDAPPIPEPTWRAWVWLAIAIALGFLAKYNYLLFAAPFFWMIWRDETLRLRLFAKGGRVTLILLALFIGPTIFATLTNFEASTERMSRLYQPDDGFLAMIDPPYLGVDGLIELFKSTMAWGGIALVFWIAARAIDARIGGAVWADRMRLTSAIGKSIIVSLGILAAVVLLADMHRVFERYLTPLLAGLPIYLALRFPLWRSARLIAPLAGLGYLAVFPGMWLMIEYGKHRYVYPYPAIAAQIRRVAPDPAPILAKRHDDEANLTLALGWRGAKEPTYEPLSQRALLVWKGRNTPPKELVPEGFGPADAIATVVAPLNRPGAPEGLEGDSKPLVFSFQLFERLSSAAPRAPGRSSASAPGSE